MAQPFHSKAYIYIYPFTHTPLHTHTHNNTASEKYTSVYIEILFTMPLEWNKYKCSSAVESINEDKIVKAMNKL